MRSRLPPEAGAVEIGLERPILHVELGNGRRLHPVNVHLKSKIPINIPGQKIDDYTWRSADAWAEGTFVSSMKRISQALEVRRLVDRILHQDSKARIVVAGDFNAAPQEVPVKTIRGDVEDTGNSELAGRILVPIEHTIPESARYTPFHQGRGQMLDHLLITRNLLADYLGSEIHNEILHDESAAFAIAASTPNPTTPPSWQVSTSDNPPNPPSIRCITATGTATPQAQRPDRTLVKGTRCHQ